MMRLEEKFRQLKREGKKAFIAYVPFGFPTVALTKDICLTLAGAGVDVIELGIPFSDPLADGPIIQKATTEALSAGANLDKLFKTLVSFKKCLDIPVVIMTYYNPIFKFGLSCFCREISRLEAGAMLVVDLPVEESAEYIKSARNFKVDTVFFVTPTTSDERIRKIVRCSKGFIYYISVTGITGPKDLHYSSIACHIRKVKELTKLPVCVGFGIHTRGQVVAVNKFSDGVIVGSSIVKFIDKNHRNKSFLTQLKTHVSSLCLK